MRRELAAGTRLLIGISLLAACSDGEPESDGQGGASPSNSGDSEDDSTANSEFVTEGGLVLCGNPFDCPDSSQECRKDAGERVGYCVGCETDGDCGEEEFCAMGQCSTSLCDAGEPTCADTNVIAACNEQGTGFVDLEVCDEGVCSVVNGEAICGPDDPATGTGGATSVPATGGTASGGSVATGGSPSAPGPNLITNGDFASGNEGWDGTTPVANGQACVSWTTTLGWNGSGAGVSLESGSYTLSFDVDSAGVELEVKVGAVAHPFEPVLLTQNLTASTQTYDFDFPVASEQSGMGLAFNVASDGTEFCLDNVSLRKN